MVSFFLSIQNEAMRNGMPKRIDEAESESNLGSELAASDETEKQKSKNDNEQAETAAVKSQSEDKTSQQLNEQERKTSLSRNQTPLVELADLAEPDEQEKVAQAPHSESDSDLENKQQSQAQDRKVQTNKYGFTIELQNAVPTSFSERTNALLSSVDGTSLIESIFNFIFVALYLLIYVMQKLVLVHCHCWAWTMSLGYLFLGLVWSTKNVPHDL